ncbi:MAG: murein L,D-transpeptidase catalytic domain family protein [Chitinophagaceae bacterium]|nr:murein L,D-transpeptidase catalytic domain family protein [Chitinophagaceae bacterium]
MNSIRKYPFLSSVLLLLFLQLPVYYTGNAATNKRKSHLPEIENVAASPVKSFDELVKLTADSIYNEMDLSGKGLETEAFELAYKGYSKLLQEGLVNISNILTIADFSKSSSQKRLFVLDMEHGEILFNTFVAHGRNSGLHYATSFSNKPQSNKSSLGFYLTLDTYYGANGYSLKLRGLEKGINDKAYDRAIVLHGSDYVNNSFASSNGFLGRSFGCPAVPRKLAAGIINTIKNGSLFFIYYPAKNYIDKSTILNS